MQVKWLGSRPCFSSRAIMASTRSRLGRPVFLSTYIKYSTKSRERPTTTASAQPTRKKNTKPMARYSLVLMLGHTLVELVVCR